uniref:C2H2-type domain-containing protein n=1 Tax=Glossina pallidipes TaxID=7398 RepID=A0A1B0ABU8_GLOPL
MFDCFPTHRQRVNTAQGRGDNLKDWKCPLCGKILTFASRLEQHVKSHLENKREFRTKTINIKLDITCAECSEDLHCFEEYHQELNSAHEQLDNLKQWKCPSCEKVLTSVHRLEKQLRSHLQREPKMSPCSKHGAHFPRNDCLNALYVGLWQAIVKVRCYPLSIRTALAPSQVNE